MVTKDFTGRYQTLTLFQCLWCNSGSRKPLQCMLRIQIALTAHNMAAILKIWKLLFSQILASFLYNHAKSLHRRDITWHTYNLMDLWMDVNM